MLLIRPARRRLVGGLWADWAEAAVCNHREPIGRCKHSAACCFAFNGELFSH